MSVGNVEPIKQILYVRNIMRALCTDCELFIFESALEPILEAARHLHPRQRENWVLEPYPRVLGRALGSWVNCWMSDCESSWEPRGSRIFFWGWKRGRSENQDYFSLDQKKRITPWQIWYLLRISQGNLGIGLFPYLTCGGVGRQPPNGEGQG